MCQVNLAINILNNPQYQFHTTESKVAKYCHFPDDKIKVWENQLTWLKSHNYQGQKQNLNPDLLPGVPIKPHLLCNGAAIEMQPAVVTCTPIPSLVLVPSPGLRGQFPDILIRTFGLDPRRLYFFQLSKSLSDRKS